MEGPSWDSSSSSPVVLKSTMVKMKGNMNYPAHIKHFSPLSAWHQCQSFFLFPFSNFRRQSAHTSNVGRVRSPRQPGYRWTWQMALPALNRFDIVHKIKRIIKTQSQNVKFDQFWLSALKIQFSRTGKSRFKSKMSYPNKFEYQVWKRKRLRPDRGQICLIWSICGRIFEKSRT